LRELCARRTLLRFLNRPLSRMVRLQFAVASCT
jgi:hypothetical protein